MQTRIMMPSNIALIKYMGKSDVNANLPANASISLTLPEYHTTCIVAPTSTLEDQWINDSITPLNAKEINKACTHIARVKAFFHAEHIPLAVSATNNFPMSCGMASSASSMAAITMGVATYLVDHHHFSMPDLQTLAALSRQGSGSSCRSFMAPFVRWDEEGIQASTCPIDVQHRVMIISREKKHVSSSEAHQIISQSPLLKDRIHRANERADKLFPAIQQGDWPTMQQLSIEDSIDMHRLLEANGIFYRNEAVKNTFTRLDAFRQENPQFKPITTMDAGPNIHFLLRPEDVALYEAFEKHLVMESI
jgi:diphosphomevalonate decarboxylase